MEAAQERTIKEMSREELEAQLAQLEEKKRIDSRGNPWTMDDVGQWRQVKDRLAMFAAEEVVPPELKGRNKQALMKLEAELRQQQNADPLNWPREKGALLIMIQKRIAELEAA